LLFGWVWKKRRWNELMYAELGAIVERSRGALQIGRVMSTVECSNKGIIADTIKYNGG